ncbi:MAG: DVU0298 family protein, partial [Desulfatitalea sp.]
MAMRRLKEQVLALLRADDLQVSLSALAAWPPRQVVNPLIGLLYHGDPRVRWHAVAAMGVVVGRLADEELEVARVVMRRLMWSLNDESGGIGWGAPEAMGEIMACHQRLACE